MLDSIKGLFRPYFKSPQRYHVEIAVHAIPNHSSLILPYPCTTPRQTISDVTIYTTGQAVQHDGFFVVTNADTATVSAQVNCEPYSYSIEVLGGISAEQQLAEHRYLESDDYVQSNLPEIQATAAKLTAGLKDTYAILERLYSHTLEHLTYGNAYAGLYTTQEALTLPQVDCGGFSTYLAALARACGIPSRIVAGFWAGDGKNHMHAWLECLLPNNDWLPIDASVAWLKQRHRTKKLGGFGELGSDRIVTSVGSHHVVRLNGVELPVGILQVPLFVDANNAVHFSSTNYITAKRIR